MWVVHICGFAAERRLFDVYSKHIGRSHFDSAICNTY